MASEDGQKSAQDCRCDVENGFCVRLKKPLRLCRRRPCGDDKLVAEQPSKVLTEPA